VHSTGQRPFVYRVSAFWWADVAVGGWAPGFYFWLGTLPCLLFFARFGPKQEWQKKGEENKGNIAALGKWGIAGEKSKSYKRQITRVWLEFYTLLSNSIPLLSSGVPFGSYLLGRPDASEMEECTARKTAEKKHG